MFQRLIVVTGRSGVQLLTNPRFLPSQIPAPALDALAALDKCAYLPLNSPRGTDL